MNLSVKQEVFQMSCHILGTTHTTSTEVQSEEMFINHIFVIVFNSILIFPTILLNAVSIIPILKSSQLNSKPCYFIILVQSMIDLGVGVLAIPLLLVYLASGVGGFSNCFFSHFVLRLVIVPTGLSSITLSIMTMERYIAILHPYAYTTQVTRKKLLIYVGCGAAAEFSVITLSLAVQGLIEMYGAVKTTFIFFFIAFAYTRIYLVVKKLARSRNKTHDAFSEKNLTRMKLVLGEIKQAKSCFVVVICFCILSFLPTASVIAFLASFPIDVQRAIVLWIITFALLNSSVNSVILFWTKTMLRKEAGKMLNTVCFR